MHVFYYAKDNVVYCRRVMRAFFFSRQGEEVKEKADEKEHAKHKEVMITFHDIGMNRKFAF